MIRMLLLSALMAVAAVLLPAAHAEGPAAAAADESLGPVTKLPLPRYVSLRSNEINVRRGPGLDYRKDWVFHRSGLPVKVVDEYGDWRRIVDSDGAGGWVYHSLLSGRRTVLITAEMATLRDRPVETAVPVAKAEQGVVAQLRMCRARWCELEIKGVRGWALREQVWGIDAGETAEER